MKRFDRSAVSQLARARAFEVHLLRAGPTFGVGAFKPARDAAGPRFTPNAIAEAAPLTATQPPRTLGRVKKIM